MDLDEPDLNGNVVFCTLLINCILSKIIRMDLDEPDLNIDVDEVPADIQEAANRATLDLLPSKSRQQYDIAYNIEQPWICYLVSRVSNTILPTTDLWNGAN
ncbi:hypothetical protein QE152_g7514 [Popillia japonica]|uniref:Uncharacterized protein n=1 Tax=Popillia japonica TaxID=7064 RepID=A0AAW1MFA9_POPJA